MSTTWRTDPSTPIQPPPHSAGRRFKGLRSPIDPSNIPSPTVVQDQDQEIWTSRPFYTLSAEQPPLATSDYVAIDQGNSSPRFIRLTSYAIPHTGDLTAKCEWPLGAVLQPFAPLHPEEEEIPLVECGDAGPIRCNTCQAYVNPFVEWIGGGQRWKCNLCGSSNDVGASFFSHLDTAGRRLDYANRLELQKGTVDFTVTSEYNAAQPSFDMLEQSSLHASTRHKGVDLSDLTTFLLPSTKPQVRTPASVRYVFALDVSADSIRSGFLSSALYALREILFGNPGDPSAQPSFPRGEGCTVAFMSYSDRLHFFDLSPDLQAPRLLVVSDLDDSFVPLEGNWFVDPDVSRAGIENLLEILSRHRVEHASPLCATGSVVNAIIPAMSKTGGHVIIFTAGLVTSGLGICVQRDENQLAGTKDEKTIFSPQGTFWPNLAERSAQAGIAVDMFVAPLSPIDLASIGTLAEFTGGRVFFHPKFDSGRDHAPLVSELKLVLQSFSCYDVNVKVRCSTGLRVSACHGSFYADQPASPTYAVMHASSAFAAELKHTGSLAPGSTAYIQCATLYTSRDGRRRVRCHNLAVDVKPLIGEFFARTDLTAGLSLFSKSSAAQIGQRNLSEIKRDLVEHCVSALFSYRINCSAATAPTQLIIPEALKTLPVYILCLMKSKALKGSNVISDVRCHHRLQLLSMPIPTLLDSIYPKLYALHDLEPSALMPGPDGHIHPPAPMRLSYLWMESGGLYLIDNSEVNVIWVGGACVDVVLRDLFDVDDFLQVSKGPLPSLPTLLSQQVGHLLEFLAYRRGRQVPLLIARQNLDAAELEFSNLLFEDENNDGMSYTDFLCEIHDQIRTGLKTGKGSWKSNSW
ncbi:hypothetical protein CALCODRAFT_489824 [Calocera cornea HHB12733]|uniref:Uncharacterized protein n=1 Tax=Calocera cornea HHB12733 TaxID=1353952 RepID=A0A165JZ99_9BASI|nr:hypothetical protein CALCODRAFT_489824 [Calocera cornea HHB12733]